MINIALSTFRHITTGEFRKFPTNTKIAFGRFIEVSYYNIPLRALTEEYDTEYSSWARRYLRCQLWFFCAFFSTFYHLLKTVSGNVWLRRYAGNRLLPLNRTVCMFVAFIRVSFRKVLGLFLYRVCISRYEDSGHL